MQNKMSSYNAQISDNRVSVINLVSAIISWIITVIWMIEIFRLSSETGDLSSFRSRELLYFINNKLHFNYMDETLLRDLAHVIEYAVLAFIGFISLIFSNRIIKSDLFDENRIKYYKSENEVCILCSLWISALFAIFDEYHQLFITGRSGSIIDVCIDAIGFVTILLIIKILFTIRIFRIEKHTF